MTTKIVKWGNSQGIRLPKYLLESTNLNDNDSVEITTENNLIIIKKVQKQSHLSLKKRLENFNGEYVFEECDTGESVGREKF